MNLRTLKFTLFLYLFICFTSNAVAQISGTVYRDFNANGTKDNSATFNEVGVGSVTINAYNAAGTQVGSVTSAADGSYSFTGLTLPVRIEFIPVLAFDFDGSNGAQSSTSVQFYSTGTTNANFGLNYPANYCQDNPLLVTPTHKNARPSGNGTSQFPNQAFIKYPYSSTGQTPNHTLIAYTYQIGTTWGVAYNKSNGDIYTSAFIKRHASMVDNDGDGKEDIGAIYKLDATGNPSLWLDLGKLSGVDVGLSIFPTIAQRGLPTTQIDPSHDVQVFDLVGKAGIGDIDISDDDKTLYVVSLYDKKLYSIDIATKTLIGGGISIPNTCSSGSVRPFGVKYHRGKIYLGTICDAATGMRSNLTATIFRLDGSTFTSILSYPLDFKKGATFQDVSPANNLYGEYWNPWVSDFNNLDLAITEGNGGIWLIEPQPILSDIEFDVNEDMIMIFTDREGHQLGNRNFGVNTSDFSTYYFTVGGGDILRASYSSGNYVLESNGSSGGNTTAGVNNNQGPGGGEYYMGDFILFPQYSNAGHYEIVEGGSALLAGKSEIANNSIDPLDARSQGTIWLDNNTGVKLRSYEIYPIDFTPLTFGKANGLGDLELLCNPAPIEIGNRVWMDTDNDGVQDADEMGLDNITVKLYNGTTLVATKTTANGGQYYFNTSDGVLPNTTYTIRIEAASFPSGKFVTLKDQTTGGIQDLGDNDASLVAGNADISYTTGNPGENNHTLDFGFTTALTCSSSVTATPGSCNALTNQYSLTGQITLTNPPLSGDVTVQIVGGLSQTFNLPQASPLSYTFNNLTADGASHTVNVTISGVNCASTINYTAPVSCIVYCPIPNCTTLKSKKVINN